MSFLTARQPKAPEGTHDKRSVLLALSASVAIEPGG